MGALYLAKMLVWKKLAPVDSFAHTTPVGHPIYSTLEYFEAHSGALYGALYGALSVALSGALTSALSGAHSLQHSIEHSLEHSLEHSMVHSQEHSLEHSRALFHTICYVQLGTTLLPDLRK